MSFSALNMHRRIFDRRYQSNPAEVWSLEAFPGLQEERCSFESDRGQKLIGHWYTRDGGETLGVLVLAHGLCGGHRNYLDVCNAFTENGLIVFAYDATANGESEGDAVGGFPQGVADLDHALRYVKAQERCRDLPIALFGHSWGGYSVGAVLNFHPDVRAVVSVAGFDTPAVMMAQSARKQLGALANIIVPLFTLREHGRWGEYASAGAMKGFSKSEAQVMIIHSDDDNTVDIRCGYDRYFAAFSENERFRFVKLNGRGHDFPLHENGVRGPLDKKLMRDIIDFTLFATGRTNDAL